METIKTNKTFVHAYKFSKLSLLIVHTLTIF